MALGGRGRLTSIRSRRSPWQATALVHALLFVSTMVSVIVVPLLPKLQDRYSASGLEIGLALTIPSLAMLLVSLPAGALADRFGARRVFLAAAILVMLGTALQAFAPSLLPFLIARGIFGVGWGITWAAGPSLLLENARAWSRSIRLGVVAITSGLAFIIGPALGGLLFSSFGQAAPFMACAALAAVIAVGVLVLPEPAAGARASATPHLRNGRFRELAGEPNVLAGVAALGCTGFSTSVLNLVIPLGLHADGASASEIGLAFSAAAAFYVVGGVTTVRLTGRFATFSAIGMALCAITLSVTPALISVGALALVVALMLHTPVRASLGSSCFSLLSARESAGSGTAIGLLNMSYAAASALGPVVAGALVAGSSVRPAFVAVVVAAISARLLLGRIQRAASRACTDCPATEIA
jgi:MFS family permease